ncbi:MAG TPA: ABC transporter permease [Rhodothermia bacterium]|nr:ABC transporter permease [Rhodothermia bacterium]
MFPADLKTTLRAIRRQPIQAGISIFGLAVGMASFILIALFVREELRFDRFHEHADRIVRVTSHYEDETGIRSFARSYPAIGPAISTEFAEVASAVRLQRWTGLVRYEDRQFNEQEMFMVDPSFFEVFTFPLVRGDPRDVFGSVGSVVITESTARRYFREADPLGKTLVMADTVFLEVAGVVSDPPPYSHIQFSMLMSMDLLRDRWAVAGNDLDAAWTAGTFYTYLLMSSPGIQPGLDGRLAQFVERHVGDQEVTGVQYSLQFQPQRAIPSRASTTSSVAESRHKRNVIYT